ncbi:pre-mRNA splicing factor CLF1 [Botrytis cinerea]
MALPKPKYSLDDSCSILYNNTLYAYNSEAFQSLSLVQGANWTQLPKENLYREEFDALYIVGGTSSNATSPYTGLQRYNFNDGTWDTITTTVLVAQNRLWHSAVYLNASDSILMYAGSQDGSKDPSSQTFTIAASPPYNVLSYGASITPPVPAVQPLLLPWSSESAIYIGGTDKNTAVMEFNPVTAWVNTNSSLATPIYNTSAVKAVMMTGDDESKNLYTFDMTVTPNTVNRTVLVDGSGSPVQSAEAIVSTIKRSSLTEADWPAYNGTLAPTSTRTSYSVAMGAAGQVVISGGNDDDVLCVFGAGTNSWVNATSMLVKSTTQQIIVPSSSSSSTSSSVPTSTGNTTATATESTDEVADTFPVKILGAVLGSIIGIALLLIAVLILLRWRRKRRDLKNADANGYPLEKDGLEFSDRGLANMHSSMHPPQHGQSASQGSYSSMAILMGRIGHRRGEDDKGNGSAGSGSSSQFNKTYKTTINDPTSPDQTFAQDALAKEVSFGQDTVTPRPRNPGAQRRGSTRRSSGWNRYWSGGSAMTSFLGIGESRQNLSNSDDDAASRYSDPRLNTQLNASRLPSQITTTSALVPPLKIPIPGDTPLYRVATNSPTVSTAGSHFPVAAEMSGKIEGLRPDSYASNASSYDGRSDAYSSGVPESVNDPDSWATGNQGWSNNRPSNAYTVSVYTTNRDTDGGNNFSLQTPQPPPPTQQQNQPSIPSDMSWINLGTKTRI